MRPSGRWWWGINHRYHKQQFLPKTVCLPYWEVYPSIRLKDVWKLNRWLPPFLLRGKNCLSQMIYAIDIDWWVLFFSYSLYLRFFNLIPELHPCEFALGYILFSQHNAKKGHFWSLGKSSWAALPHDRIFSSFRGRSNYNPENSNSVTLKSIFFAHQLSIYGASMTWLSEIGVLINQEKLGEFSHKYEIICTISDLSNKKKSECFSENTSMWVFCTSE